MGKMLTQNDLIDMLIDTIKNGGALLSVRHAKRNILALTLAPFARNARRGPLARSLARND